MSSTRATGSGCSSRVDSCISLFSGAAAIVASVSVRVCGGGVGEFVYSSVCSGSGRARYGSSWVLCLWEMERQKTSCICDYRSRSVFVQCWGERGTGVLGLLCLWEMEQQKTSCILDYRSRSVFVQCWGERCTEVLGCCVCGKWSDKKRVVFASTGVTVSFRACVFCCW